MACQAEVSVFAVQAGACVFLLKDNELPQFIGVTWMAGGGGI